MDINQVEIKEILKILRDKNEKLRKDANILYMVREWHSILV